MPGRRLYFVDDDDSRIKRGAVLLVHRLPADHDISQNRRVLADLGLPCRKLLRVLARLAVFCSADDGHDSPAVADLP